MRFQSDDAWTYCLGANANATAEDPVIYLKQQQQQKINATSRTYCLGARLSTPVNRLYCNFAMSNDRFSSMHLLRNVIFITLWILYKITFMLSSCKCSANRSKCIALQWMSERTPFKRHFSVPLANICGGIIHLFM